VLRYSWNFGDGTKSGIINPTKKFVKPGNYPVTLTVQDDSGLKNSTHSDRAYVRVHQAPVAKAGPDILACTRVPVQFNGTKSFDLDGVVNRYSWDFADGTLGGGDRPSHAYSKPGVYRVTLNIVGDQVGQCDNTARDQLTVRVLEAPIAKIISPVSTPLGAPTPFDGSGSTEKNGKITDWLWNFGDGATAKGARATHIFKKPGLHKVTLTIKSATAAPACQSISTSRIITVNAPPVAVAGDDIKVSVGEEVRFDGGKSHDSDGGITAFSWDFGDGISGKGLQPVHAFARPGNYRVKLVVKDASGLKNDSAADTLMVTVTAPPLLPIMGPDVACVREPVTWQATLGKNGLAKGSKLTWLLGDGTTSRTDKVTHSYQRPGKFNITLFVDETKLLKSSRRHLVRQLHVNQPPRALAGPDQLGCAGKEIVFDGSASRDLDGKITTVKWDFGDGETSDKTKTRHIYKKPGTYSVSLTVRDDTKSICSVSTDKLKVVINAPPVAVAGPDINAFVGGANDAVLFNGAKSQDPDGDNLSYRWHVRKGLKLTGSRVRHLFTQTGDVQVKLTVRDGTGLSCGVASDTMTVKVRARNKN
jgi:large repetitive protein